MAGGPLLHFAPSAVILAFEVKVSPRDLRIHFPLQPSTNTNYGQSKQGLLALLGSPPSYINTDTTFVLEATESAYPGVLATTIYVN